MSNPHTLDIPQYLADLLNGQGRFFVATTELVSEAMRLEFPIRECEFTRVFRMCSKYPDVFAYVEGVVTNPCGQMHRGAWAVDLRDFEAVDIIRPSNNYLRFGIPLILGGVLDAYATIDPDNTIAPHPTWAGVFGGAHASTFDNPADGLLKFVLRHKDRRI